MRGLMMDFPLTLSAIFRRAEQVFPGREIVTRRTNKSLHRYTYRDFADRARRLASALQGLGIRPGDRVATLGWNHYQHLEAYFGIPLMGSKDLIKSGGEWISSVALESALMGHPAVAEAAVIPVASRKWTERPLATVVLKGGASASAEDLRAFLAPNFPKFWLPDAFEFIDAIPRTSAGKFQKSALRSRFKDYQVD
jgi:acyl-CoA synthetase (AMP-forming)/AMP-acid ligase II